VTAANDVIAAIATPHGLSALAVIRLSGQGCSSLVECAAGLTRGRLKGMRRARLSFPNGGDMVALGWPPGKSYTGEEMVELICHGIPERVSAVYTVLIDAGARPALPGEFTSRAWKNGKLSDHEIFALAAAVETGTETEPIPSGLIRLQTEIGSALEALEGEIEFQDEACLSSVENDDVFLRCMREADMLVKNMHRIQRTESVYISGPVNAGKSTLFNTLGGKSIALVHPEPGTTRDGARTELRIGERRFILIDTPGFGGEGIDRDALETVMEMITEHDTIVWLSPDGKDAPALLRGKSKRLIQAVSKSDTHQISGLRLSSVTGEGIAALKEKLFLRSIVPIEEKAMQIAALIREANRHVIEEPAIAASLLGEAEAAVEELTGCRHGLHAVERALSVLCVGK